LRLEIGQTVSAPHEIDVELQHLRSVVANQNLDFAPPTAT
jgi:hypothetical protein